MEHNPHNLKPGDTVILDKGFTNEVEVIINGFMNESIKMFVMISFYGSTDIVMTSRLTPKE